MLSLCPQSSSERMTTMAQPRKRYKTDLTDAGWDLIRDRIPPAVAKTGFEPTDLREVINTILYQNHTSCPWDMLPHDLCAKSTAFDYFKAWQDSGLWQDLLDAMRTKVRLATPRPAPPQDEPSPDAPVALPASPAAPPQPDQAVSP